MRLTCEAAVSERPELTTDGVHLNAAGARVWASALRAALD
jgi:lysophospholipase L1-like esterase